MSDSAFDDGYEGAVSATPMQITRGSLVVSLQRELDEQRMLRLQRDLLARIQRNRVRGVILDLTAVETMDSVDYESLRRTLDMVALMGTVPVIVGLRPGIVSALVTMNVDISGIRAAANLDRGLEVLERMVAPIGGTAGVSNDGYAVVGPNSHPG